MHTYQTFEPDGHYTPQISVHSLDKIRLHNYYAELFATSMKNRWEQRVYLGLYAGAGRALVKQTGEIIETSALGAFRLKNPFTKYIFVDQDARCTQALQSRIAALPTSHDVTIINKNVNEAVPDIRQVMPRFSKENRMISLCFVDPFAANLKLTTLEPLSKYRMDFMVLLMLGRDARTNWAQYYDDTSDTRIAQLTGDPSWREEWRRTADKNVIRFIAKKFDAAMSQFGYQPVPANLMRAVRLPGKNVLQYYLVLYSKHKLGLQFWRESMSGTADQTSLELE